jgi:hypothetical protein
MLSFQKMRSKGQYCDVPAGGVLNAESRNSEFTVVLLYTILVLRRACRLKHLSQNGLNSTAT